MSIQCSFCGDTIFVGDEYYHNACTDLNYHLDCKPSNKELLNFEKRYKEE